MKILSRLLIFAFVLLTVGIQTDEVNAQSSDYNLVIMQFNQEGNRLDIIRVMDIFTGIIAHEYTSSSFYEAYISPNNQYLTFFDEFRNVLVIDGDGNRMLRLPEYALANSGYWYLWGWRSNEAIVLVHLQEQSSTFYQVNIHDANARLVPIDTLTGFFGWNIRYLEQTVTSSINVRPLFQFSPDFTYLLTPVEYGEMDFEGWGTSIGYLWHLEAEQSEIVFTIQDVYEWWFSGFGVGTPAWSYQQNRVAFAQYSDNDCVEIWVFSETTGARSVDKLECNIPSQQDEMTFVEIQDLSWSLDDTRIAYWIRSDGSDWAQPSSLIVINLLTDERVVAVDRFGKPNATAWHPNGHQIAFTGWQRVDDEYRQLIGLVDLQTNLGSTFFIEESEEPSQSRLLGWLRR